MRVKEAGSENSVGEVREVRRKRAEIARALWSATDFKPPFGHTLHFTSLRTARASFCLMCYSNWWKFYNLWRRNSPGKKVEPTRQEGHRLGGGRSDRGLRFLLIQFFSRPSPAGMVQESTLLFPLPFSPSLPQSVLPGFRVSRASS